MRFFSRPTALLICFALVLSGNLGCAVLGGSGLGFTPVRISDLIDDGDPQRRASLRLVDDGLSADAQGQPALPTGTYIGLAMILAFVWSYVYRRLRHRPRAGA